MKAKPLNLRHERRPVQPIKWLQPKESFLHRVQDGETWIIVARKYGIKNPKYLIHFNFSTTVPEEVNWYLREYVGCNVSVDTGRNWAFSKSAFPGIIYIPIKVIDFSEDGEIIRGRIGVGGLITEAEYNDKNFLDTLGKALDIYGAVDLSIGVSEVALPLLVEGGLIVTGAAAAIAAPFFAIGAGHADALKYLNRQHFFEGFSIGLVMSANEASANYIKQRHELQFPPFNAVYPEKRETFRKLHNIGLMLGIKKGEKFNTVDRKNFFIYLHSQLSESDRQYYTGRFEDWSERKKRDYYDRLSSIVKDKMISNNLQLKVK